MVANVMLFVKSLSELVRPEVLLEVNNGQIAMPDLNQIVREKHKMDSLKDKFATDHAANLSNIKRRATGEIASPDGLSNKQRHHKAILHWFNTEKPNQEKALTERLQSVEMSRRSNLPMLEPLPSSEDSWLAWTSEDEYLFDRPVQQMWKEYDDEQTALVKVDYIAQGPSQFDAQPEVAQDMDEYLEKIDVGTATHGGSMSLNYWVE
ncbi:MAG: hypothetical protein QG625_3451 [Cyanobacteriota bacterium erpe_2018_sw_39hr_WHONDRS-SW48-000098_B_bin.30]|nr:hypothetical protein [Cyanobacteriota bacterium erpe_2018_sw_39hr_WHONDRS-SW48-000098_B_bin.30]